MISIDGALRLEGKRPDFTGYRVTADYDRASDVEGVDTLPASQSAAVEANGRWHIDLAVEPRGQVILTARAPSGVAVGSLTTRKFDDTLVIPVEDIPAAVVIPPSDNETLGHSAQLTGRALQPDGSGVASGLPVILWGKPPDADPLPLLVAATAEGGYFGGPWPALEVDEAWGVVGGSDPIAIALVDGHLPRVVLLVMREPLPVEEPHDHDDCACHTPAPPRAPTEADLVSNPAAFSEDLGGGTCVNLTMPNRTLEELVFHAVVRTTEPEIKGTTLDAPTTLPATIATRMSTLMNAVLTVAPAASAAAVAAHEAPAPAVLRLDAGVVADELRNTAVTSTLIAPDIHSLASATATKDLRRIIDVLGPSVTPGRVALDRNHVVDWDDDPTIYQATTIAIGHLLTLKQIWRADGYSLGDLLYSLPLAPGQRKQIAIVDWERRESTMRRSRRDEFEQLDASLAHDRDISDIMSSALAEHSRGSSSADVSAVGGGIGAFIGPIVLGGGGGHSSASSTAHSHNWRDVSGIALNQARDRTQQAASVVRGQRSSTIQTTSQGESLRAQTEVVGNYNHCHALSIEYFEVLRHFQVHTELADVQECLFIPFELTEFTANKALRWREPLSRHLRRRDLAGGFAALERIRTGWVNADFPPDRYADEAITELDGELQITFNLPRPADDATDGYVAANWSAWTTLLAPYAPADIWSRYLGTALPAHRDAIWNEQIAQGIAAKLVNSLQVELRLDGGTGVAAVALDPTLVSRFREDHLLQISLQPELTTTNVVRNRISAVRISLGTIVPYPAKVVVRTGSMHYRTEHISHHLFVDYRLDHELSSGLHTDIGIHLDRAERRNPRKEDMLLGARLVAHLNERLEFYHQAIWREMHPNRRYLLLDGVIAPNANGRSVASVVENRLVGIVGNCLVMPVVPGLHLDPGYKSDPRRKTTLIDLYAADAPPPIRISVPTKGTFAEAVPGACNSCEKKDDARFWRWEESPIPEALPGIAPVSTGSRRTTPPDLRPDAFPDPVIKYQDVPASPDPTGLGAALRLIGTPNVFRDLTGLDLNQQASAAAFGKALETAQFFGTQAGNLAQQRYANREMDRNLARVDKAVKDGLLTPDQGRALTEQFIRSGTGRGASSTPAPSQTPAVQRAMARGAASQNGSVSVSRPSGSVAVNVGDTGPIDFDVNPPVTKIAQPSPNTCWAAGGAMMLSWHRRTSLTIQAAADEAGAGWRTKLDGDQALSANDVRAYATALHMGAEAPMCYLPRGLLKLLREHGPLWVVGDDAIDGNHMAHVRVVTGMHGDGTSDGTQVRYIDPADGASHEESFTVFSNHMEATDASSLNLGFYHF